MRIIAILPIQGPLNGVKVISQEILRVWDEKKINYQLIDTSQAKKFNQFGKFSFSKITQITQLFWKLRKIKKNDFVYMNLTAHGYAFIRDFLIIKWLLFRNCNITIHLHESTLKKLQGKRISSSLSKVKIIIINDGQLEDLRPYYQNLTVVKNALPDYYAEHEFKIDTKTNKNIQLLSLSNLSVPKGSPLLYKIVNEIETKNLPYSITICGGVLDSESANILSKIKDKNGVNLLDPIHDIDKKMELYAEHDFLLFLSDENYEVYPLVYIEALMNGVPIISTRQVISTDIIKGGGTHLVDDSIEKTIESVLKEKTLLTLRKEARRKYEKEYDFQNYTSNILKIIYAT